MKTCDFLDDYQKKLIWSKEKQVQINLKIERYKSYFYLLWVMSAVAGMWTARLLTQNNPVYLWGPLLLVLSLILHLPVYILIVRQGDELYKEKKNQLRIEFDAISKLFDELVEDGIIYLPHLKCYQDEYPELLGENVDLLFQEFTTEWVEFDNRED